MQPLNKNGIIEIPQPPSMAKPRSAHPLSMSTDLIALDIGGANIKAADGLGWVESKSFELWRHFQKLPAVIEHFLSDARPRRVVATMTGEIADCYQSRQAGVQHIITSLQSAVHAFDRDAEPEIYLVDGSIVSPEVALGCPLHAAGCNWHAVARLAASYCQTDKAFLIDIGSTTTDIVAILNHAPAPLACNDLGRMSVGELVYTGIERTPIASLVRSLPLHGSLHPVASELFAQSRDVWLLLGELDEQPFANETADGGPVTREAARVRMARMLLADPDDVSIDQAAGAAEWCAAAQSRQVARALSRVSRGIGWQPTSVIVSGHGECLARRALQHIGWNAKIVSLPDQLGSDVSRVAPAHALAMIARGLLV